MGAYFLLELRVLLKFQRCKFLQTISYLWLRDSSNSVEYCKNKNEGDNFISISTSIITQDSLLVPKPNHKYFTDLQP